MIGDIQWVSRHRKCAGRCQADTPPVCWHERRCAARAMVQWSFNFTDYWWEHRYEVWSWYNKTHKSDANTSCFIGFVIAPSFINWLNGAFTNYSQQKMILPACILCLMLSTATRLLILPNIPYPPSTGLKLHLPTIINGLDINISLLVSSSERGRMEMVKQGRNLPVWAQQKRGFFSLIVLV